MEDGHSIRWEVYDPGSPKKDGNWYWAVGIIAGGVGVAGVISGNYLFALIAVIGGFAIMLAGSQGPAHRSYRLSEAGLHVAGGRIPYANIRSFAIHEDAPRRLVITTESLMGTLSIPLGNADFRAIRTEFKNRDIEEDEGLDSVTEKLARAIGL